MREIDRIMTENLDIQLLQMMENAGRALATRTREMLGGSVDACHVLVLAGAGGNGGGGMAAARRLKIWGAKVSLILATPSTEVKGVPRHQLDILRRMGVPIIDSLEPYLPPSDIVLDALIGYSLQGAPRGMAARLITTANSQDQPILSLDIPSGLDGDNGTPFDPCIQATSTLTLALPKRGLLMSHAKHWVGELHLADISVPSLVYETLGIDVGPIFAQGDIVKIL